MQSDPQKSVDAQIAEHMTAYLADTFMLQDVRYVDNTRSSTLRDLTTGTVVRTYIPEYWLEDSDRIRISVTPNNMTQLRVFRDMFREDYYIYTDVHQRIMDPRLDKRGENLPSEDVEERQGNWIAKSTEYGDEILKIADQVSKAFEDRDGRCCVGAKYSVPESEDNACAVWLNLQRGQLWQFGESVNEAHVVGCRILHHWVAHRKLRRQLASAS